MLTDILTPHTGIRPVQVQHNITAVRTAKLYYLFDYGDEWWHEITLQAVTPCPDHPTKRGFPRVTKTAGQAPPQYEYDDEDE